MGKKRLRKKRTALTGDLELQITSLADIFVVVLVFLLKYVSLSVEGAKEPLVIPAEIKLPMASIKKAAGNHGLSLEILETGVYINGTFAATLLDYRFGKGADQEFQTSLNEFQKNNSNQKQKASILADYRAPYDTVQRVIASAAEEGYSDFKLIIAGDQ